MPPDRFVEEILIDRYKAIEWVMGENHKFGRNREGNNDFLHKRIGRNHFNMFTVSLHSDESAVASSTTIRGLIVESRIDEAVAMLGHPYLILAERIRGKQKGKSLGFPTLNFKVPPSQKVIPPPGVYAARIEVRGLNLEGALYYGNCPTFADRDFHFEFHSVDPVVQDPKLNTEVAVWLYRFIRPDEQFSSEQLLVNQIKNDIQTIRKFFKKE
jgi:riboflavin kinase/FMN adenylyltransferase